VLNATLLYAHLQGIIICTIIPLISVESHPASKALGLKKGNGRTALRSPASMVFRQKCLNKNIILIYKPFKNTNFIPHSKFNNWHNSWYFYILQHNYIYINPIILKSEQRVYDILISVLVQYCVYNKYTYVI